MRTKGRIATLAVVCGLLLSMVGASYALAKGGTHDTKGTAGGSTTSKDAKHNKDKGHNHKDVWKRVRGQVTVKDKKAPGGFANVTFEKGTLTSADSGQIAFKQADGTNQTFTPDSDTKVRVDGKKGSVGDLKPNMEVAVYTKQGSDQSVEGTKLIARTPEDSSSGS